MKALLFAALVVVALGVSFEDTVASFADFKRTYRREYENSVMEAQRFKCFQKNLQRIKELNAQDKTAVYGINHFADLCADEFKAMYHNAKFPNMTSVRVTTPKKFPTVESFDWRDKGAVNSVKDQGQCGSCWTFSAVAAMEGAWAVAGNGLLSLSEEELVQCADTAGQGCQGGWMDKAIQWAIDNGGINSESAYPYTSGGGNTGTCNQQKKGVSVAKFSSLVRSPSDEGQMLDFLQQNGPLSIAVDAMDGWQTYQGGVKSSCNGNQVDHGVAIVGFGTDSGTDYWIVRNSWGSSWGEQGYIRLRRNVNCDLITYMVVTAKV